MVYLLPSVFLCCAFAISKNVWNGRHFLPPFKSMHSFPVRSFLAVTFPTSGNADFCPNVLFFFFSYFPLFFCVCLYVGMAEVNGESQEFRNASALK